MPAALRAVVGALELFRRVFLLAFPVGPLHTQPLVETELGQTHALVVANTRPLVSCNTFSSIWPSSFCPSTNSTKRLRDDGVVLLCAVIIPVMLDSVPDLLDILDRFLLLGGDTEAEVLQARERITNADCLRVVGDLRVDVLEDENRVCLREPLLLGSYKSA
jgi:hypothetical protein